jgi:hypothetical protein
VLGCFEYGNEQQSSIAGEKYTENESDRQLLQQNFAFTGNIS